MPSRRVMKLGDLRYRSANWKDWANVVVNQLFALMYKLGISVETMIGWLKKLQQKLADSGPFSSRDIPEDVVGLLAKAISASNIPAGDFLRYCTQRLLEDPPKGYRKKKDDLGNTYIVKQTRGPKSTERPLHRGAKFRDKVFVGGWWYTDNPRGGNHARLRNLFKKAGGGIFHKEKSGLGFTEYYAYAILPEDEVLSFGMDILPYAEDLKAEEGDRDYRLSAARLDSLADGEPVKSSDTFTAPRLFKSTKFNWELNLPDVLNGRSKNQQLNAAVKDLLRQYQP